MSNGFTRWTLVALLSVIVAGCAADTGREERPHSSDAPDVRLPCTFAGFSGAESFPCVSGDSPEARPLVVRTTLEDAREKCSELREFTASQVAFQPRWTLEIKPSDSEARTCTLRFPSLSELPPPLWSVIEELLLFAIGTDPEEADEFLRLMIGILEQMRAHLAETTNT